MGKRRVIFNEGDKIGNLTIIGPTTIEDKAAYELKCICGKVFTKETYVLSGKKIKSCGCQQRNKKEKIKDINIGYRFGNCIIKNVLSKRTINKNRVFECLCDCGNICEKTKPQLSAKIVNCGCVSKGQFCNDHLIGSKFGKLTIIEFDQIKDSHTYYKYICDCGVEGSAIIQNIKKQESCGCVLFDSFKTGYKDITGQYWAGVQKGAIKRSLSFNITKEFIWELYEKQNRKCALTGRDIVFGNRYKKIEQTCSIDRIDSFKGYSEDNVQIVHKNINCMKMQYSNENFKQTCYEVIKYTKYKGDF